MQLSFACLQHLPPLQMDGKQQSPTPPVSVHAAPRGVHAQFPCESHVPEQHSAPVVHGTKKPLQHFEDVQRSLPQHPVVSEQEPPVGAQHFWNELHVEGAQHSLNT